LGEFRVSQVLDDVLKLVEQLNSAERQELFSRLKNDCICHPLERQWSASAELILDAIAQSSDLTQRGVRGVIADRAFHRMIVPGLERTGWRSEPIAGDLAYDADLRRGDDIVTVQVKMQRRERQEPYVRSAAGTAHWVVEVQKTRSGQSNGEATRPYAFGNFDILAVNLYASTSDWSHFVYTVANWLIPRRDNAALIAILQPVAQEPNDLWTRDFDEAVAWLRSGEQRRLPAFDGARGRIDSRQTALF
jgi:hypothetical protein